MVSRYTGRGLLWMLHPELSGQVMTDEKQ